MLARISHTRLLRYAGLFTWAMVGLPLLYSWLGPLLGKAGDEEKVLEAAIEAGADDVESEAGEEGGHAIWTSVDSLHEVARELEKTLGEAEAVKLAWRPSLKTEVGESDAQTLFKLIDVLDDDDDVQTVWGNYEVSDAIMEKLG